MAENLEDALRDSLAEDRPRMPEAILAREVVRLRSELAQAKAEAESFKCASFYLADEEAKALVRAESAELALKEQERVIDDAHVLLRDIVAALRKEPAVQGLKYDELGHRANSMIRRLGAAPTPPQAEKPKDTRCYCDSRGHQRAEHPRSGCIVDGCCPKSAKGGQ